MDELHSQYPALSQQLLSQTFHKHQLHTNITQRLLWHQRENYFRGKEKLAIYSTNSNFYLTLGFETYNWNPLY